MQTSTLLELLTELRSLSDIAIKTNDNEMFLELRKALLPLIKTLSNDLNTKDQVEELEKDVETAKVV